MAKQIDDVIMMNKVYTREQIKNMLTPVFLKHNVRKAVLFGSYVKDMPLPQSDIDILVDSGLRGLAFFGLLGEVVKAVGKDVDLIDTIEVERGSRIDREINDTGVVIFEK